jgi:hypothetical protein
LRRDAELLNSLGEVAMKIARKLQRELLLIAFDLRDGEIEDVEAMCETLEAIAAEGRKELERRKQEQPQSQT